MAFPTQTVPVTRLQTDVTHAHVTTASRDVP